MNMLFRCSSIGKIMTEPKSIDPALVNDAVKAIQSKTVTKRSELELQLLENLKLRSLSVGAKTYIRDLAKEEIFGTDFMITTKYMEKGIAMEDASIEMLNRVRGFNLKKNTERKSDGLITGECDLFNPAHGRGHDLKNAFDLNTFPAFAVDAYDSNYEWQMRGYMRLWDVDLWEVNHTLLSTPPELIGKFDRLDHHQVDHIPECHRLTTWTVERDRALEAAMDVKLAEARVYYGQCIQEFDKTHQPLALAA